MNSIGQQEPLSAPPRPLRSIKLIYVSEGRAFCTKDYLPPNYTGDIGGGGGGYLRGYTW